MWAAAPHLDKSLQVFAEVAAAVAVPEEGHVAELLRLAARERRHAVGRQVLAAHVVDGRGRHQEHGWQLQVAVVLHHPHEPRLRASS